MDIPMKTVAFVTFLAATPSVSAADQPAGGFDGFVSGAIGHSKSSGSASPESTIYDLAASLAYTHESKWGGQLDYINFQQAFKSPYPRSAATDIAGHLYFRDNEWLVGGFIQKRKYFLNSIDIDTHERFLGVEGQIYRENMTFYGQLGNDKWTDFTGDINGNFVATKLTYFVNDNLNVSGGVDLVREDKNGYSYSQNSYKLGIEGRMTNSPLSIFAGYTRINEWDNSTWNVSTDIFLIGGKLNFGKGTLRSSGREGASLMPAPRVLLF
jgi:hypothetical protein